MSCFGKMQIIGEGTYGKVYKAELSEALKHEAKSQVKSEMGADSASNDQLNQEQSHQYKALKLLKLDEEREGFPITALREIQILKKLNHKNIVRLEDIFILNKGDGESWQRNRIYLVFEFVPHDLMGIIDYKPKFTPA